jgi:chorismate lyase / 3-hydroxybenzoate synthase
MTAKTQDIHDPIEREVGTAPRGAAAPPVPAWAVELVGAAGEEFALTSARVADAVSMDAATLEARVAAAYGEIAAGLRGSAVGHPVRLWNYVPSINGEMGDGRDRYMVFNAGRYRAFAEWYGGDGTFDRDVATASGVGHDGRDLVIHCLAARAPGVSVENPRQVAPHRYSDRYGPVPPCFARATVLEKRGLILVGGTASIRGEASVHGASLAKQLEETLTNLASVVGAAYAKVGDATARDAAQNELLARYRELRVYYPRAKDARAIESTVRRAFAKGCRIEMVRAGLCRAELLVEIEGVAGMAA